MKKIDVSRLERWRSVNLRVGFALSLFLVSLAFNYTSERPPLPTEPEEILVTDLEIIPSTSHPEKKELPPPPEKLPLNVEIIPDPNPPAAVDPTIFAEPQPVVVAPHVQVQAPPRPQPVLPKPTYEEKEEPFVIVENMPRFPGCEEEVGLSKKERAACAETKLLQHLAQELYYPAMARENGVEGTVVVRFIVEKDGSISNVALMRDIGAGCGEEALRVIKALPKWVPGEQRGRKVRVQFTIPVRFKLNG